MNEMTDTSWESKYCLLREPKIKSGIALDNDELDDLIKELQDNDFNVRDYRINIEDYKKYMNNAGYQKFPWYHGGGTSTYFKEKSLEHYLAAALLQLSEIDTYIDIASSGSPAHVIYKNLFRCRVYSQDLKYEPGIHGNTIGGDAGSMPVEDAFVDKMALHCSFEHFENDADIKFIKEANRVLRPGGKVCIVPLYLYKKYAILTDPAVLPQENIFFEKDAVLYCRKGWKNRHGRFYDVPHLSARIRDNLGSLSLTIYVVTNEKEVGLGCYVKFMALLEKTVFSMGNRKNK